MRKVLIFLAVVIPLGFLWKKCVDKPFENWNYEVGYIIEVHGKKLGIAKEDLNGEWEANDIFPDEPWRLPTNDELEAMYYQLSLNGKGNFKKFIVTNKYKGEIKAASYLSITGPIKNGIGHNHDLYYVFYFKDGSFKRKETPKCKVRLVKPIDK